MNRSEQQKSRFSAVDASSDVALAREDFDNELLSTEQDDSPSLVLQRFLADFSSALLVDKLLEALDASFVLLVGLDEQLRISFVIDHAVNEEEISEEEIRLFPAALNKNVAPERYSIETPQFTGEISDRRLSVLHFTARTIAHEKTPAAALIVGFRDRSLREESTFADCLLAFASHVVSTRLTLQKEIEKRKTAEEHLRRAQKLSNVGKLASGIAHDFNNLLTVIQGHAALLELSAKDNEEFDEKSLESLGLIMSASQQAVDLTKQLLLFGRNQSTNLENCNLNSVVEDFVKMIRRMIEESIEISVRTEPSIGSVKADKSMIGQILMNLIINARDAMPDGGSIEVKTDSVQIDRGDSRPVPAGHYVRLTVADTGAGISPQQQRRIFDPFYSTKGKGKGTGLGLANVASIVEDHRGHIDVTSQEGHGTTFEILIPVVRSSPEPPRRYQDDFGKNSLSGCNVLLVEDESAVRKLVRKLLEMLGCQVIEAGSGKEALELWPAISEGISVVVTDVVMPGGVSGWDLAKELHDRDPKLGILLTSGYNERPEDHGLADKASIAFLQKPYESNNLKNTLSRLLELKKESA